MPLVSGTGVANVPYKILPPALTQRQSCVWRSHRGLARGEFISPWRCMRSGQGAWKWVEEIQSSVSNSTAPHGGPGVCTSKVATGSSPDLPRGRERMFPSPKVPPVAACLPLRPQRSGSGCPSAVSNRRLGPAWLHLPVFPSPSLRPCRWEPVHGTVPCLSPDKVPS